MLTISQPFTCVTSETYYELDVVSNLQTGKKFKICMFSSQRSVRKKSHPILQLGISLLPEDNLVSSNFKLYVHSLLAGTPF